jgi:hypothetical protein
VIGAGGVILIFTSGSFGLVPTLLERFGSHSWPLDKNADSHVALLDQQTREESSLVVEGDWRLLCQEDYHLRLEQGRDRLGSRHPALPNAHHVGRRPACQGRALSEHGEQLPDRRSHGHQRRQHLGDAQPDHRLRECESIRITSHTPCAVSSAGGFFSDVFVPPVANDSGSGVGTAIDAQLHFTGHAEISWDVYPGCRSERIRPSSTGTTSETRDTRKWRTCAQTITTAHRSSSSGTKPPAVARGIELAKAAAGKTARGMIQSCRSVPDVPMLARGGRGMAVDWRGGGRAEVGWLPLPRPH